MGEHRTEKSRYPSRFGGGWLTPIQWLVEYICERQALRAGTTLPVKFWTRKEWAKEYRKQASFASRKLSRFDPSAISKALQSKQGKLIGSLGNPNLMALIEHEQKILDTQRKLAAAAADDEPPIDPEAKPAKLRPAFVLKESPMSKLKRLDF